MTNDISKPTLVFFHAFPFSSAMWEEQVSAFSKTHKCLTPDLPGFGSAALPDHPVTFEFFVDSALEFLKKSGAQKSIWCGLSMGGYLALRLFERAPELCSALILCDTKSGADNNEGKLKRAGAIQSVVKNREEFVAAQWKALVGESSQANTALKTKFESLISKTGTEGIAQGLVALASRTDTTESLAKINVPTLIVVGSEDKVTPVAEAQAMNKAIRESRLTVIEKAGHLSCLENPSAFNEALGSFLAR